MKTFVVYLRMKNGVLKEQEVEAEGFIQCTINVYRLLFTGEQIILIRDKIYDGQNLNIKSGQENV